jgi:hypothetical protein
MFGKNGKINQNKMTVIEKAQELVNKMYDEMFYYKDGYSSGDAIGAAKKCALIAVDEILENSHTNVFTNYWNEVKQEIEKL